MNRLVELYKQHKQSFWIDFINRHMLASGELKRRIEEDDLRGMTSNPSIFEKAISAGNDYDADIKKLAALGRTREEIFWTMATKDIQNACDIFRPVFKQSKGDDGYVSLEVSPDLARDTEGTIAEAKKLFKNVGRPNVMIKIPGTPECIASIEESLAAGLNINITLLFSVENYKQVLEAYVKALERRVKKGQPIKDIASVASFFVSRVDTIIDKALEPKGNADLLHKAAIANAKLAYEHYLKVVVSPRFEKLRKKGARVQRLLWASTSTKDKRLVDTIYIDELIGPDTVNTMPVQTADAFKDHGKLGESLTKGVEEAHASIAALAGLGIDVEEKMNVLQEDGVRLFSEAFASLLRVVGGKAELLTGNVAKSAEFALGNYRGDTDGLLEKMAQEKWVERIWSKDATLWKSEEAHQNIIQNSLGWLYVIDVVRRNQKRLKDIAADIKKAGFTHALLLGMGGSSLCPEVLRLVFGKKSGFPDLAILDSTEPASVLDMAQRSKPEKTLYIVASKSGTTTEPNAFLAYFFDLVKKKKGPKAGENFIAITDPGTLMERIAQEKKFRHIVLNPSDIGGRYSALSYFGMVPAALMGLEFEDILSAASRVADACSPMLSPANNPGAALGAALGVLAQAGRNKLTFFLSPEIGSFSTWMEQLVAESTGKEGKGILPVESEAIQVPSAYGNDRVFVYLRLATDKNKDLPKKLEALGKAGHPIITITLPNKAALGGEFFRWEFATAVAGAVLGIDAFDQPNVQESKDLTKNYLEIFKNEGRLPANGSSGNGSLESAVKSILEEAHPGDYVALLAYVERNPKNWAILQSIRHAILKARKVTTTVGFGPRFLHSTGQLHKGGPDNGLFVQITADDEKDVPIPGEPYTYSVLKEAQALGDLSALKNKGRRAIRIHLKNGPKGLIELKDLITKATLN